MKQKITTMSEALEALVQGKYLEYVTKGPTNVCVRFRWMELPI